MIYLQKPKTSRQRFAPKVDRRPIERRIPEWRLQAEIISEFHKLEKSGWPFTCAGDMNQGKRSLRARSEAKVTGMTEGEPDVRVYLPKGRLGLIEIKADGGRLSDAQIKRHAVLKKLGHEVITLQVKTLEEAKTAAVDLLKAMLGMK